MEAIAEKNPLLAHEVDFSELENELSAKLGLKNLKLIGKVKEKSRGEDRFMIEFESNELANQAGFTYHFYKTLKISDFGGGYSKEFKKFYALVNLSWEYKNGGSNGTHVMHAEYTPETKVWEFKWDI